ncbi:tRNA (adenosine(37)-N6)-threonylcarbamoyltransferase complex ATPase subunit type 1 TsaE [Candidatus Kaiserbacteria bacterium]|nr:tRNA (adenosine(37)-N6)-threonylcarbamoyltransferase complex ATPase subunit type 1 TsaE [Candidatus Kaiserbacteria bacterium]
MQKVVKDLTELESEAKHLLARLALRADGATLITLSGELGAGKTALAKALARALGITEVVSSPTFVLEKIYRLPAGSPFARLVHIDAYRLESGAELAPLGFDEIMQDPHSLVILEWPERVADALPPPALAISLVALPDHSRQVEIVAA